MLILLIASALLISCGEHTHTFGEWTVVKEATCTETGLKERVCTECQHSEKEDIPMTEHTESVIQSVEPTCSAVGFTEGKCCSVCNKILESPTEIAKKSHTFGEWTKSADGTCLKKGKEARECSVCKHTESRDTDYAPHKLGEWVNATAPTAMVNGVAGHYSCSVCGKAFRENGELMQSTVLYYEAKGLEIEFNSDNTWTIVGAGTYEFPNGELIIPTTVNGYPIRSIGDYAFKNCTALTKAYNFHINYIGKEAFSGCINLTSVPLLPETVKEGAFKNCSSLLSVDISSLTKVEDEAFMNCSSLSNVTIGESLKKIGRKAFMGCDNIWTPATALENTVFLPASLTEIGDYAFAECENLVGIVMWDSNVTKVGTGIFANCPNFQFANGLPIS